MVAFLLLSGMGLRVPFVLLGLSLVFAPLPGQSFSRQDVMDEMKAQRPQDLQLLIQRPVAGGELTLGIYSIEQVATDPQSRRYRLWEESPNDINVYFESVRCSPTRPVRVKRTASAVYVRTLNPGGAVSDVNREDHLVWWAACVPEVAGTDPGLLRQKALDMGFSTLIPERQEQLPALAP